jgi:hypothetical protein
MSRHIAHDDPGRLAFAEVLAGPPAEVDQPAPDPRPNRPTGSVDQGTRGASIYNPREAWRQWLDERLGR